MNRVCPVFNNGSEASESMLDEFHTLAASWSATRSSPGSSVGSRLDALLEKLDAAIALSLVRCVTPDNSNESIASSTSSLVSACSTSSVASAASVVVPSSSAAVSSASAAPTREKTLNVEDQPFCCPACRGVLSGAVVLPCGDSFCKKCVHRDVPAIKHRLCAYPKLDVASWTRSPRSSVVVVSVVEKLWSDDLRSVELRNEGNALCESKNFVRALDCYRRAETLLRKKVSNAVDLGALLSNTSFVLQHLGRNKEALEEAEEAVELRPSWSKARYRLACAFISLGRWEEAFKALVMTAILERSALRLANEFSKVLEQLLRAEAALCDKDSCNTRLSYSYDSDDDAEVPRAKRREVGFSSLWRACLVEAVQLRESAEAEAAKEGSYFTLSLAKKGDKNPLDISDVECPLCLRIFWEPVTTPCGHTFCRSCLYQALDSSAACPLCKGSLHLVLAQRIGNVTKILEAVTRVFFPEDLEERRRSYISHLGSVTGQGDDKRLPLFVCGVALPSLPCPLHVYEPRYRLMIRRCMESGTRQFGVCACDPGGNGFSAFGTVMEIRDVHYFPDGRSIVETIGSKRFKVLRARQVDGYFVGDIEVVEDDVPTKDGQIESITSLIAQVRNTATTWFEEQIKDKTAIFCEFGPLPKEEAECWKLRDGPAWVWWIINVLPIAPEIKLKFLSMLSLEKRLLGIQRIIDCSQRSRPVPSTPPERR